MCTLAPHIYRIPMDESHMVDCSFWVHDTKYYNWHNSAHYPSACIIMGRVQHPPFHHGGGTWSHLQVLSDSIINENSVGLIGHQQPPTPISTYYSSDTGIINNPQK